MPALLQISLNITTFIIQLPLQNHNQHFYYQVIIMCKIRNKHDLTISFTNV